MEAWKPIPGYEGLYDASNLGRIRSTPGKVTSNARYSRREWASRIMREKTNGHRGDRRICLWKDGKEKTHLVARLVASAWHGDPDEGMTVNHINGDPTDNRACNLEWLSLQENIRHGFANGLYGSVCKMITLVDDDGNAHRFASLESAGRWLGRGRGYLSDAGKHGRSVVTSANGKKFSLSWSV